MTEVFGRGAAKVPRDHGPVFGQEVGVRSVRKLGRHGPAPIAFIQIARAFHEFIVGNECPVVLAARCISARAVSLF